MPLLLVASAAQSQELPELLEGVGPGRAQRLVEYNSVFLDEQLYFAKRYRIVNVDTSLFVEGNQFTITPFPNSPPIQIELERSIQSDDGTTWSASIRTAELEAYLDYWETLGLGVAPPKPQALMTLTAWDVDEAGNAELSSENRFEFSPYWRIDEFNTPILELPEDETPVFIGPPPRTPDEIARHKQLTRLKKRAFQSLYATLGAPPYERLLIVPLQYTPRYAVVYEEDPAKRIEGAVTDRIPGESPPVMTPSDRAKLRAYRDFQERLQLREETNRPVKGDL